MKTNKSLFAVVLTMVLASACAKKATPEECAAACQNAASLATTEQPSPGPDGVAQATAQLVTQVAETKAAQQQALDAMDADLAAKLGAAKSEAETAQLSADAATARAATEQQQATALQTVETQGQAAVATAQAAAAQAQSDASAAAATALAACSTACTTAGDKQATIACRAEATTLADYQNCK